MNPDVARPHIHLFSSFRLIFLFIERLKTPASRFPFPV